MEGDRRPPSTFRGAELGDPELAGGVVAGVLQAGGDRRIHLPSGSVLVLGAAPGLTPTAGLHQPQPCRRPDLLQALAAACPLLAPHPAGDLPSLASTVLLAM